MPAEKKFKGGNGKTRPKNTTIKPPFTLSVSCMKIQGHGPPAPSANAHASKAALTKSKFV